MTRGIAVVPAEPRLNAEQELVVRVASVRNAATTGVRLVFPPGLSVAQFAPAPGWRRDTRPHEVAWSGGRVAPGEYAEFRLLATPGVAGRLVFRATQTYADGVSTRSAPAITAVALPNRTAAPPAVRKESSDAAIWLGLIAIIVALGSALATGFLWSTWPAQLPPDDPDETCH